MSVWYVNGAPYFSKAAAKAAAKPHGLPVIRREVCPACNGNGARGGKHCLSCLGSGEIDAEKT